MPQKKKNLQVVRIQTIKKFKVKDKILSECINYLSKKKIMKKWELNLSNSSRKSEKEHLVKFTQLKKENHKNCML